MKVSTLIAVSAAASLTAAQTCNVLPFTFTPVTASGWRAQLVATGLRFPRHIVFDTAGYVLIAERSTGISRWQVGSCGTLLNRQLIISDTALNHGLTISADGRTIFASSVSTAWSWSYDPATGATSNKRTLITGMQAGGHSTRSLYASITNPDLLLASWGSDGNFDWGASDVRTGRSAIRGFSIAQISASSQNFATGGTNFGWGLRNSVGIGEHSNGGLWSVENSADNVRRNGQDVHNENPGEELNYHGLASDTTTARANYGYPDCLAVWDTATLPSNGGLQVGSQFSNLTGGITDAICSSRQAPRLTFPSHTAPLDIKFDAQDNAWISFHGSWNRSPPDGYRVSVVSFGSNGQPVAASTSRTSYTDIMWNRDNSACPSACFRPTGLAIDRNGRIFVTSDSTGEVYLLERTSPQTTTSRTTTTTSTTTTFRTSTTTSRTTTTSSRTTTTSSRTTTTTTSTRTTTATGPTQTKWGQCGGIGYSGPTACVSGSTCQVLNPYYSQCL